MQSLDENGGEQEEEIESVYVIYNRPRAMINKAIAHLEEEEQKEVHWSKKYTLQIDDCKVAKRLARILRRMEKKHPHLLKKGPLPPPEVLYKIPGKTRTVAGLTRTIFYYEDNWFAFAQRYNPPTKPIKEEEIAS